MAMFLETLAHDSPKLHPELRTRIEALVKTIRNINDSNTIEFGLQAWPVAAMKERENLDMEVLLIGISSSHHESTWTYNQRPAPEYPKPDAWIYVPGKMLLVFEFKNDEHPLDATQISTYAHRLGLLHDDDGVPQAKAGGTLASAEDAKKVQTACAEFVLNAPWSKVVEALKKIKKEERIDAIGCWLCGKAADYVEWHIFPLYCGIQTILEWLNGPDEPDRRNHLRRLVGKMGDALGSAECHDAITFAKVHKDQSENYDFKTGAGSPLYVKLMQNGTLLQRDFLGEKVDAVLWFWFTEDKGGERIGLEYYIQAKGSQCGKGDPDEIAWNAASERHLKKAEQFEKKVDDWIGQTSSKCLMNVSTVRFNGKKLNWQGGGIVDPDGKYSNPIELKAALKFLQDNRDELWCFPRVGSGETVANAAEKVRKPALSLLVPLDIEALEKCENDASSLQKFLQNAIKRIES